MTCFQQLVFTTFSFFVVFSLRGRRNKVIITVISPEVMSPVTRIMFKTQVKLFFLTKSVGNGKSCPLRFFQWRFSAVVVVAVYYYYFSNAFLTAAG